MTTDTAVRVTRMIVQDRSKWQRCRLTLSFLCHVAVSLDSIPYVDDPEIKVDEHESTEMPFRYVLDKEGKPIMPEVRSPHHS